jgi:hypothetical protein
METDGTDPVEIARFTTLIEAELALSVLAGSGIEGHLDQPFTGSIAPHITLTSGGIRLFVPAEDAERAAAALQQWQDAPLEDPGE